MSGPTVKTTKHMYPAFTRSIVDDIAGAREFGSGMHQVREVPLAQVPSEYRELVDAVAHRVPSVVRTSSTGTTVDIRRLESELSYSGDKFEDKGRFFGLLSGDGKITYSEAKNVLHSDAVARELWELAPAINR